MEIKRTALVNKEGQVLPLILLVILVAATIGFSIAGTAIKNIEETNLNEESNRAYSAAEAGLEEKLLELEQGGGAPVPITTPTPLQSGAYIKEVTVEQSTALNISKLEKDSVAQINLDCATCVAGTVSYTWDEGTALVVTKIHGDAEPYTVSRYAYECGSISGANFDSGTFNVNTRKCTESISVDNRSAGGKDRVIRFRAMYADTSLSVSPSASNVIPVQSTVLTSTGQSGETERTVQVQRSAPVPPSILDYVLFSSQGSLSK